MHPLVSSLAVQLVVVEASLSVGLVVVELLGPGLCPPECCGIWEGRCVGHTSEGTAYCGVSPGQSHLLERHIDHIAVPLLPVRFYPI